MELCLSFDLMSLLKNTRDDFYEIITVRPERQSLLNTGNTARDGDTASSWAGLVSKDSLTCMARPGQPQIKSPCRKQQGAGKIFKMTPILPRKE